MRGYDHSTYGEGFADVYDDWYGDITDVGSTVEFLGQLAIETSPLPMLELGVGTARLALPLALSLAGRPVWGLDSSPAMLARAVAKKPPPNLHLVQDDMVEGIAALCPGEVFGLIFVAFNTFFNLTSVAAQQRCFTEAAGRLASNGYFVLEAFVPDVPTRNGDQIEVKSLSSDRVVLSIAQYRDDQRAEGQFVEFTESSGVRLRPWSIRYASPEQLDTLAESAGLVLRERWENFARDAFTEDSPSHISVYGPT